MADKTNIAIVEADQLMMRMLDFILDKEPYNIVPIRGSTDALSIIRQLQPDLVVLDSWLETKEAGWRLLQDLKKEPSTLSIPVILFNVDTLTIADRRAWLAELVEVVMMEHPFTVEALRKAVKRITEKKDYDSSETTLRRRVRYYRCWPRDPVRARDPG